MRNPERSAGTSSPPPTTDLCGYRLVRVIAQSAIVTSWVATPAGKLGDGEGNESLPPDASVMLSRFTPESDAAIPSAMLSVSSPFVQRALDLATDNAGAVVLITERTHSTLAALLDVRDALQVGEAVTILAPVVSGVQAVHREGFAHGALSPATIAFTSDGRPLITLLSDPSSAAQTEDPAADRQRDDVARLGALVSLVLERSDGAHSEPVAALLRWLERNTGDPPTEFFTQLELRLFALADPIPIAFTAAKLPDSVPAHVAAAPSRALRQRLHMSGTDVSTGETQRFLAGLGLASLGEIVDGFSLASEVKARFAGVGGWLARTLRGRAVVLAVGTTVAILALWGGLALVPPAETPTTAADRQSSIKTTVDVALTDTEKMAIESDDPTAAVVALLAVRSRCLQSDQPACLALVNEPGSAAAATDEHVLDTNGEAFLPLPIDPAQAELLQRTGSAALFRVDPGNKENQPVLVLVMRTNAGWRVRDLAVPG